MCTFCDNSDPLEQFGEWFYDDADDTSVGELMVGLVIDVENKELVNHIAVDYVDNTLCTKHQKISFCPMCGRKL